MHKLISHLPNRYYKDYRYQSRKVMHVIDINIINLIICLNKGNYKFIFDSSLKIF